MVITIRLNGQMQQLEDPMSLLELMERLNLPPLRVMVERNREVVPRHLFGEVMLRDGDELELIRFVSGG